MKLGIMMNEGQWRSIDVFKTIIHLGGFKEILVDAIELHGEIWKLKI